jgi:hypothetical protein
MWQVWGRNADRILVEKTEGRSTLERNNIKTYLKEVR